MSETTASFAGKAFRVSGEDGDHIFEAIRSTGTFYEPDLLGHLATLRLDGRVAVDVGANIGNHALFFAGVLGMDVVAFEPNYAVRGWLSGNVQMNGLRSKVEIRPEAAGAEDGYGAVEPGPEGNLGMAKVIPCVPELTAWPVPIVTLDDFFPFASGKIGILKVDVEGMEMDVLSGARKLIEMHRPICAVEARSPWDVRTFFRGLGYLRNPLQFCATPTWVFDPR